MQIDVWVRYPFGDNIAQNGKASKLTAPEKVHNNKHADTLWRNLIFVGARWPAHGSGGVQRVGGMAAC